MRESYVIGVDYGTDSARAILLNARSGAVLESCTCPYLRWKRGLYSDASESRFRHHPLDYQNALRTCLEGVVRDFPEKDRIVAIGVDTTASTPCLTTEDLTPLCLTEEFAEDPDAMFFLWKDHTGMEEAHRITLACRQASVDYSARSGYTYSPENFWSKALHALDVNPRVRDAAKGIIELSDYITMLLCGKEVPRGLCAAWSKALYATQWGGYPPRDFFLSLGGEALARLWDSLPKTNVPATRKVGTLSSSWCHLLGLSKDTVIASGHVDAHSGAVGAGCAPGRIVLNLGTSACVMAVEKDFPGILEGVFGQATGSILEGYEGFEMGMSSFGDNYAWLRNLLFGTMHELLRDRVDEKVLSEAEGAILGHLAQKAEALGFRKDAPLSTDYFNGRRTPRPDSSLKASVLGLDLSTSAADLFRSLVEATAFGIRAIKEHLEKGGVAVRQIRAIGGIARKSPYVVQTLSDVLAMPVEVPLQDDLCALGAAIQASVSAGLYPDAVTAQDALCCKDIKVYNPRTERNYDERYDRYLNL